MQIIYKCWLIFFSDSTPFSLCRTPYLFPVWASLPFLMKCLGHPLHLLAYENSSSVMLQLNVTSFLCPPFSASLGKKDLWLPTHCSDNAGAMHGSVTALVTLC